VKKLLLFLLASCHPDDESLRDWNEPTQIFIYEQIWVFERGSPRGADTGTSGPALRLTKHKQKRSFASRGVLPAGE
jgi:hypothetical protein